jgi:glycine cleavage system aminomethyltransferase T
VRSAGYGHTIGATTFSAYLPAHVLAGADGATRSGFEVEVMNQRHPATMLTEPPYDPSGAKVRG